MRDARSEWDDLVEFAGAALAGGIDIIQLRYKGSAGELKFGEFSARETISALNALRAACRRQDALLAVDDRADLGRCRGGRVASGPGRPAGECARSLLGDQILIGLDRLRPLFRGTLRCWRPGLS